MRTPSMMPITMRRWEYAVPWIAISYAALALIAVLPRVVALGGFVTADEHDHWLSRSETFLHAVAAGDYAATALTEHPGVTTMWLGSAGLLLQRSLLAWDALPDTSVAPQLAVVRFPAAMLHALGILVGYAWLRRLLSPAAALLAALLWATDPFSIAYSRVLHVDALLGTFATLSLLAACTYWHHHAHPGVLVASGVCTGLALLSKSPAVILLPTVLSIAYLAAETPRSLGDRRVMGALLVWGAAGMLTVVVLWPALWTRPVAVFTLLRDGVVSVGGAAHDHGNVFLGHVDAAPGLLFYPVALVLRLTPWTLVGLLALGGAIWQLSPPQRRDVRGLATFVLLLLLALTLFPKKFNRYLVPAFPALDTLAAIGLVWGSERVGRVRDRRQLLAAGGRGRPVTAGVLVVIAAAALLNVQYWHPYPIAAYNQLFGGARAGRWAFLTGWGEGLELVGAWLNQQPDITRVFVVLPPRPPVPLQPHLREGALAIRSATFPDQAGYAVLYVRHLQLPELPAAFERLWRQATPLHVVSIHGVPYAWIYQLPPPVAIARAVNFGTTLHLRGGTLIEPPTRQRPMRLKVFWEVRQPPPPDMMLFVHVIGPDGKRYAQLDLPVDLHTWQPGRYATTEPPPLALPADAPLGHYHITLGVYSGRTGRRLAVPPTAEVPELDGADAVVLTTIAFNE